MIDVANRMEKETIVKVAAAALDLPEGEHSVSGVSFRLFQISLHFVSTLVLHTPDEQNDDYSRLVSTQSVGIAEGPCKSKDRPRRFVSDLNTLAAIFDVPFVEFFPSTTQMVWRDAHFLGHISPMMFLAKRNSKCVCALYPSQSISLSRYALHAHRNFSVHSQGFNLLIRQLLELFNDFAMHSLLPLFSPRVINANDDMWLNVDLPAVLNSACLPSSEHSFQNTKTDEEPLNESRLWEITGAWCTRRISNFEYILKLNQFAGRVALQPDNHPIMPWVCDFSSKEGGWRPLDRTKYRLNKGDAQLKEMYCREPAHHVPELLSDIGYMVYRARRESKEVLCQHVRSKWVPEEYPRSMSRMYEWTPDECIPEFYEDETIFKSVHPDMCDIELPEWCDTVADFIRWHRSMLESDEVSESLHKWIDLVFGYQLSGDAAVSALNVHLSLLPVGSFPRKSGVVQLFSSPHPKRCCSSARPSINPLDIPHFNPLYTIVAEEKRSTDATAEGSFSLSEFVRRTRAAQGSRRVSESAMSIAVTVLEIALAEHCRDLSSEASFEDRLERSRRLLSSHGYLLPGHIRNSVQTILCSLQTDPSLEKGIYLSSWLLNTFNLPSRITQLHARLVEFHSFAHLRKITNRKSEEYLSRQLCAFDECLRIGGAEFAPLLGRMVSSLLNSTDSAVPTLLICFPNIVNTFDSLHFGAILPLIKNIYDNDIFYPNVLKLLDRRFLVQLSVAVGTETFLSTVIPSLVESLSADRPVSRGDIIRESLVWLSRRYGPVITATHISPNLLRMLALCYTLRPIEDCHINEVNLDFITDGDSSCSNVINCLLEIAVLHGASFITVQYLPFCAELVDQALKRISFASEAGAVSAVILLQHCCNSLSNKQLMDYLQECIMDSILFPAVRLSCSPSIQFSSVAMRRFFTSRLLSSIHLLACRIGAENVSRYMAHAIQRIFCTFDMFYEVDGDRVSPKKTELPQLSELYSTSYAQLLFRIFSSVCGRPFLFETLPNSGLIFLLSGSRSLNSPHSAFSLSSGNKLNTMITSHPAPHFDPTSDLSLNGKMCSSISTQMSANCAAHFRAVLSSPSDRLQFNHLCITSFSEHNALIRRIAFMDNENCFASASLDKTVKLWSIKFNEPKSIRSQWTYRQHTRAVVDVCLLPSLSLIASTDSTLHVWDPFRGSMISQYEWPLSGDSSLTNIAPLGRATIVVASPLDNALRLVDVRAGRLCFSLFASEGNLAVKGLHHPVPNCSIRSFAISPSEMYCAAAMSNGILSLIDIRSGRIINITSQIHSDALEVRWLNERCVISSHLDHPTICWDARSLQVLRRLPDPASLLLTHRSQIISVHSSNRIKVYDEFDVKFDAKIKSDSISGTISSAALLPSNKMFLFGSSAGQIRLFC